MKSSLIFRSAAVADELLGPVQVAEAERVRPRQRRPAQFHSQARMRLLKMRGGEGDVPVHLQVALIQGPGAVCRSRRIRVERPADVRLVGHLELRVRELLGDHHVLE